MKLKPEAPVHIVAILDRSGSMGPLVEESINGFNRFLEEQKALPGEAKISVVLFDDKYEILYDDVDLKDAKPLTKETFVPRGMTALYDAIGRTLTSAFKTNPERAIICILTDGMENASQEYKVGVVKDQIKSATDTRGWQVTYLAANQDAFAVGGALNIPAINTANFAANAQGVADSYTRTSAMVANYRGAN